MLVENVGISSAKSESVAIGDQLANSCWFSQETWDTTDEFDAASLQILASDDDAGVISRLIMTSNVYE